MTDALILKAQALALTTLNRFGVSGKITWSGNGASLVEDENDQTASVRVYLGKRTTQIVNTQVVTTVDALMSPVTRNPIGGTVTVGTATYRVLASDDMGQTPKGIACHKLVLA